MVRRTPSGDAMVLAAMRLEAVALGGRVVRIGMGPARAEASASALATELGPGAAVALVGISGGLDPALRPGEVVVATAVRGPEGDEIALSDSDANEVAEGMRGDGHVVHVGPIVSSRTIVHGDRRTELARSGALAVDMESAWVARALAGQRLVVVRLVADTAGHFVTGLVKGLVALRDLRTSIDRWPVRP